MQNFYPMTNYLLDDSGLIYNVLAEYDDTLSAASIYTYGNEMISIDNAGETSYYVVDGQGSVRALANEAGIITDTYTYDAYGNILEQTGNTHNPYLYNQEQFDSATGLYYLRVRYMNPSTGRFISMDEYGGSIYDPASLHKYLYANASPIMYSDPTGYFSLPDMMASVAIHTIIASTVMFTVGLLGGAIATVDSLLSGENEDLKLVFLEGFADGLVIGGVAGILTVAAAVSVPAIAAGADVYAN